MANLPPVSMTLGVSVANLPAVNLDLQISQRIFEKISNDIIRGLGEDESRKKPEAKNLGALSLLKKQERKHHIYYANKRLAIVNLGGQL
jgi:hypothetical protein